MKYSKSRIYWELYPDCFLSGESDMGTGCGEKLAYGTENGNGYGGGYGSGYRSESGNGYGNGNGYGYGFSDGDGTGIDPDHADNI